MNREKILQSLVLFVKYFVFTFAVFFLVFALMSGAEKSGVLKNIPNALPWIILLVFACIAFSKEIIGGTLIVLFGIFTIMFFGALEFLWILFIISLPLILLGSFLALFGFSRKNK
jgi:hypothetical protein